MVYVKNVLFSRFNRLAFITIKTGIIY